MIRPKLFDIPPTRGQRTVAGLWGLNALIVLAIWYATSWSLLGTGTDGIALSLGRLAGLLAAFCALVQFMLMGRVLWIERQFGLDRLAGFHRLNGYATFAFLMAHPPLITLSYTLSSQNTWLAQYRSVVQDFPYVWMAAIAQLLFVGVVVTSVYIVRRHLKFETWYWVHMAVYAAIILATFHQFEIGGSFAAQDWMRWYWFGLYGFVAVNVLFFRFSLPSINLLRHGFQVSEVAAETPSTTSITINGRELSKWKAKAGQYVLVRIFARGYWTEEHPFSISALPNGDTFRLTVRDVGDYTHMLRSLQPGAFVLVSGPFGRFTREIAVTDKRLFIAGGVGITPIKTLAAEAVDDNLSSVLLYASRTADDIIFVSELNALKTRGLRVEHVVRSTPAGETTKITMQTIEKLVPDYAERDIYLCGPPAMMDSLIPALLDKGVDQSRLHFERFALHV